MSRPEVINIKLYGPWLGSVGHFPSLAIIILEIVLLCASRVAGITVSSIISGYLPPLFQTYPPQE